MGFNSGFKGLNNYQRHVSTFLKSHLQADCISRKEHIVCDNAINIEGEVVLHKIVSVVALKEVSKL